MPSVFDDDDSGLPPLYSERSDWADVAPISQYDGLNPIAPIFYTPEYKDATDFFRGVVKLGEMSDRVLELTEKIIRMNPAHYSAWQYRYRTLLALKSPLDEELQKMDEIALDYMKTYQVWHHRRLLITQIADISNGKLAAESLEVARKELDFIARVLAVDTKNYHTWSYRQWLLAHFDNNNLWNGELPYIEDLIQADVRNNSAWHHRYFVVFARAAREHVTPVEESDVTRRELRYVTGKIALAPNNASAWNYLRGILDHSKTPYTNLVSFAVPYTQPQAPAPQEDEVIDLDNPKPSSDAVLPCVAAIDFLAEAYAREGGDRVSQAVQLWKSLANEHDTMRKKYWEFRIKEVLEAKLD